MKDPKKVSAGRKGGKKGGKVLVERYGADYMRALGKRGGRPTWKETLHAATGDGAALQNQATGDGAALQNKSASRRSTQKERVAGKALRLALWGEVT